MLKVNIKKKLEKITLDVAFENENDIIGLFGASASGKSMTLKCIAGIEKPDEGIIILNDKVLFDSEKRINLTPQERRIAYLFQNYALFPQMTVFKNILISVSKKYIGDERIKKANEIIELLALNGYENKYPKEVSGGQQQRVALARIIVNEPEYLLLDEPFSSLDAFLKLNLAKELRDIIKYFNKGAIFVSHNIKEVDFLCKNMMIIDKGNIVEIGAVKEIIAKPKSEVTKMLLIGL